MRSVPVRFYFVVLVPAAVLMALEITSSRLLAPQFGSSVYVWGSIISVFLAAMSLGYLWGGRAADRRPDLEGLGRLILGAAVAQVALISFGEALVSRLGGATGGSAWGTLLSAVLLFAPATVLLATVSPYAVRLAAGEIDLVGGTAGHLYALSTLASLAGTLGATFVLIPNLEVDRILRLLTASTTLAAIVALASAWRRERLGLGLAAAVLLFCAVGPFRGAGTISLPDDARLVVQRMTPYQTLRVIESKGARVLTSDGTVHASVELATGDPWTRYARHAPAVLLLQPEMRSLLVLGLGGGSVGSYLQRRLPDLEVDYVEIDPAVAEIARRHMLFEPGPRARVHIDDARRYLQHSPQRRWDVIYADTYIGASVPFHLATVEFFQECRSRLNEGGVLAVNIAGSAESPLSRAILRALGTVFSRVYVAKVPRYNHLFLATQVEKTPAELLGEAMRLDGEVSFDPTLLEINQGFLWEERDVSDATLLTDRLAPVESLVRFDRRAHDWRRLFEGSQ